MTYQWAALMQPSLSSTLRRHGITVLSALPHRSWTHSDCDPTSPVCPPGVFYISRFITLFGCTTHKHSRPFINGTTQATAPFLFTVVTILVFFDLTSNPFSTAAGYTPLAGQRRNCSPEQYPTPLSCGPITPTDHSHTASYA